MPTKLLGESFLIRHTSSLLCANLVLPTSNHHRHAQKGSYTLFSSNTKHIRYLSHLSYFPKQHPDTKASQAICYNMNQIEKDLHLNVGVQWNVLFGAVCWSVWKNQNALNLC